MKDLRRLDPPVRDRVTEAAERLPEGDTRPLVGDDQLWRLRVGDWRVIYVREGPEAVTVIRVLPRGRAY